MESLTKDKKAQVKVNFSKVFLSIVSIIITIIVLFSIFSSLIPEAQNAGDEFSDATRCGDAGGFFNTTQTACLTNSSPEGLGQSFSAIPVASLFSGTGIVILLLMVFLFIGIIRLVMPSRRK